MESRASRNPSPAADFDGISIAAFDGVYSPREDSKLLAAAVRKFAKGRFLDLGCGTGIQGIAAARATNVASVVFADANPIALANAQFNASANSISKPNVFIQSDLFSNLGAEKFDTIAFNPPYLPTSPSQRVAGSLNSALDGGKTGRKVTGRFLREFALHLKPRGTLLLVDSSLANYVESVRFLQSRGFSVHVAGSQRFFFEEIVVLSAQRKHNAQGK